jgi:hypothetical protein
VERVGINPPGCHVAQKAEKTPKNRRSSHPYHPFRLFNRDTKVNILVPFGYEEYFFHLSYKTKNVNFLFSKA